MDNQSQTNRLQTLLLDIRMPMFILDTMGILTAVGLLLGIYLPDYSNYVTETFFALFLILFCAISLFLAIQKNNGAAALFLSLGLFIGATAVGFNFYGLRNPAVLALYLIIIPIVSLYLGRANSFIAVGLILAALIVQYYSEQLFGLPASHTPNPDEFAIAFVISILFAAILDFTSSNYFRSIMSSEEIAKELAKQNEELTQIQVSLEERVESRTTDLEKRNSYLEAIQTIAKDTSALLDSKQLIQRTVTLIAQRFDFYHVGIFLVDQTGEWAVLEGASSSGGQQMIARGHKLHVGRQGIVGFVTGIGLPRISQDIALDRIHTTTAELPDTRSEMALPLKARGEIIGALDIQDRRDNAFSQDDVTTLQVLADQIALAISNARLYAQAQDSLREVQRAYGELNQRAWVEAQRAGKLPSYRFVAGARTQAARVDTGTLPAMESPNKMAVPIHVRGQVIGTIDIAKQNDEEWSEDEREMLATLSEQLGVALDSARLFDETQQRAASEALISNISAEIRESLDMESILRTAAEKIREAMQLPEVTVRMANVSSAATTNGNGHIPAESNGDKNNDADDAGKEL